MPEKKSSDEVRIGIATMISTSDLDPKPKKTGNKK